MGTPLHFVVPGPLDQRTGGYLYDRRIVEGLRRSGEPVVVVELPGVYPLADAATVEAAGAALAAIPDGAVTVVDGLALPGVARHLPAARTRLRLVALVHHPLYLETGLSAQDAAALHLIERDALAAVRRIVVTSPFTARNLHDLDVAADRVRIVLPGTDPVSAVSPAVPSHPLPRRLLCVATVTPRKGHLVLIDALARIADLDWTLTCVGSLSRDPETVERLRAALDRTGLAHRVTLAGELPGDGVAEAYGAADLFVLPSFHEGYGMALAEALARRLPVVSTTAGAIPHTVPSDAGLLVPPGDVEALADALRRVMSDPAAYDGLRAGAERAAAALPDWGRSVADFHDAVTGLD